MLVAAAHIAGDCGLQHLLPGKRALRPDLPLESAEHVFDPVEPSGIGGNEMEVETRMCIPPRWHLLVFVDGVMVEDQMHGLGRKTPCPWAPEGQTCLVPMSSLAGVVDLARMDVQARKQGEGAVSPIIMGGGGGMACRHGQPPLRTCQGLQLGLLIYGQHHCIGPLFLDRGLLHPAVWPQTRGPATA